MIEKVIDDGVDQLYVQVAYWGFFSVFALLLVFAWILGLVFQSDLASNDRCWTRRWNACP